jgi:Na+/serine symporter
MSKVDDPEPGLPFLRRYWRGLLVRQIVIWLVIGGFIAVLHPAELHEAWITVLIGGLIFNLALTLVA